MIEVLLILVIVCQLIYLAWRDKRHLEETKKLVNAIVARTPEEAGILDATDKLEVGETPPAPPVVSSLDEVSQEAWERAVLGNDRQD